MKKMHKRHHYIAEHIWRTIRSTCALIGMVIWLTSDGITGSDVLVLTFGVLTAICDQLHGIICRRIEKLFGWKQDFNNWE